MNAAFETLMQSDAASTDLTEILATACSMVMPSLNGPLLGRLAAQVEVVLP